MTLSHCVLIMPHYLTDFLLLLGHTWTKCTPRMVLGLPKHEAIIMSKIYLKYIKLKVYLFT